MKRRSVLFAVAIAIALSACTGHQVREYSGKHYAPTSAAHVELLMSDPSKPFEKIGAISAKQYKPGFSDPSVIDADEQLKQAGAELGADAVIVRGSRSDGRVVFVDAEAVRYTQQ